MTPTVWSYCDSTRQYRDSPMAKHVGTCCSRVNADRSFRPKLWLCGTHEPIELLEYHDKILERKFGNSSTQEDKQRHHPPYIMRGETPRRKRE